MPPLILAVATDVVPLLTVAVPLSEQLAVNVLVPGYAVVPLDTVVDPSLIVVVPAALLTVHSKLPVLVV